MSTKRLQLTIVAALATENHEVMRRRRHTPYSHTRMTGYCIFASSTRHYLTWCWVHCQSPVLV